MPVSNASTVASKYPIETKTVENIETSVHALFCLFCCFSYMVMTIAVAHSAMLISSKVPSSVHANVRVYQKTIKRLLNPVARKKTIINLPIQFLLKSVKSHHRLPSSRPSTSPHHLPSPSPSLRPRPSTPRSRLLPSFPKPLHMHEPLTSHSFHRTPS